MSGKLRQIAVLKGGPSAEHEVSLRTGAAVADALRRLGFVVVEVVVTGVDFQLPTGTDFVFICLHGAFGEDGQVQGILEEWGVPYTGSGIKASQVAMDKAAAKARFVDAGVPTPPGQIWQQGQDVTVPPPMVIKPSCEGSSMGLQFVEAPEQLAHALEESRKFGDILIIEKLIRGKELTVGILGDEPLPIVEIRPKSGRYDYVTKYTAGATDYLCPAPLSVELTQEVQAVALRAHRALGCEAYSRVDVLLDGQDQPWVLEVNTIPGMTATSLLPKAAHAAGFSFELLCERIVEISLQIQRGPL
jgi:D-alanine-D-alanine ligase